MLGGDKKFFKKKFEGFYGVRATKPPPRTKL